MVNLKQWGWNGHDSFNPEGRCQLVAYNEEQNTLPQLNDSRRKEQTMYTNPFCLELCIEPKIPGNVIYREYAHNASILQKAKQIWITDTDTNTKVQVYHHLSNDNHIADPFNHHSEGKTRQVEVWFQNN